MLSPMPGLGDRPMQQRRTEPLRPTAPLDPRPARTSPAAISAPDYADDEIEEGPPRRSRRIWGLMAILTLLAVMVGGTWAALMNPQMLKQPLRALGLASSSGSGGAETAQSRPSSPASREQAAASAKPLTAASLADFPDTPAALGEMLQKGRLWAIVRESFPDWYEERVREAARIAAEKKGDDAVTKHLIDSLIALRRKNADHAFLASLPALEQVARTFRDSLELLTKHSPIACFSLISNGEGTRGMIGMFRDPAYGPTLQAGLAAVFAAIADGRSAPNNNLPARRSDYDMLTKELQSLGWREHDINLFSDSEALAKTSPEQVCKMVREWFTAHLAIENKEVRRRLLIESVKPVVAG